MTADNPNNPRSPDPSRQRMSMLAFSGLAAVAAALSPAIGYAQSYPNKAIRVLSTTPAGSAGDTTMRMAAAAMGAAFVQSILVETNPAATGRVAMLAIKNAPPDGYSLLYTSSSQLVVQPYMVKDLGYDPFRDFAPVSLISRIPVLFAVSAALPATTAAGVIDYARRNPGKVAYGSTGIGSAFHLMGEALNVDSKISMLHVPYNNVSVAVQMGDLANDRIQVYFAAYITALSTLQTGKVRIVAVMDKARLKRLPDVPTIFESSPNYALVPSWFALLAPAGTPRDIVLRLQVEARKALLDTVARDKLEELGTTPVGGTPEEFTEEMRASHRDVERLTKALGIEPR